MINFLNICKKDVYDVKNIKDLYTTFLDNGFTLENIEKIYSIKLLEKDNFECGILEFKI